MAPRYPRLSSGGYRLKATRAEARRAIARLWQRVRSSVERAVAGCPAHRWRVRWVQGPLLNSFCCVSQQVVSSGRPVRLLQRSGHHLRTIIWRLQRSMQQTSGLTGRKLR